MVDLAIRICRAISVAPKPLRCSMRTRSRSMLGLRPMRTPLAFACSRPSLVRSRILSRSVWATAERMVTTIRPMVPSVVMPSFRKRTATPLWSNSWISRIMSAVSRPSRSSFRTRITSPISTFSCSVLRPRRSSERPLTWSQ